MWDGARWRAKSRHVFLVPGYDPMTVEGHRRIFERELKRFCEVWHVEARCRDAAPRPEPTGASWRAAAAGPDWEVATTFELLAWDEVVRKDMARSALSHLIGTTRALADMVTSGTIRRYFHTSRRYGTFFLFTYVLLVAFWLVALGLGIVAAVLLAPAWGTLGAVTAGAATTFLSGVLLLRWPGRKFRLKQSLDLAEFSVDFVRGRHPAVDARVEAFGARLAKAAAEAAERGDVDEIVVAGHSLGAMLAVSAVAHALKLDPAFGTRVPVRILTLGSTAAKFALHPAGEHLRAAAREVAAATRIGWLEMQARDDMVSFYKVNPVTLEEAEFADIRTVPGDFSERPLLRHHPVRDMLTPATFARFRMDMMRLHVQYMLANDRRAGYDFFAFLFSPMRFDMLAASAAGLRTYIDASGALRPPYGPSHPKPLWAAAMGLS